MQPRSVAIRHSGRFFLALCFFFRLVFHVLFCFVFLSHEDIAETKPIDKHAHVGRITIWIILTLVSRYDMHDMLCRIVIDQIQPSKNVLDHADYTAPTRQHEQIIQIRKISALKDLDHQVGNDYLSDVRKRTETVKEMRYLQRTICNAPPAMRHLQ